ISYPKSGRTWLRALMGAYLCEANGIQEGLALETEVLAQRAGLPATAFTHDFASHGRGIPWQEWRSRGSEYAGRRVLLLTRNIKDTLVSAYFHATKRRRIFDGPISQFVRSDVFGAKKLVTF